MSDYIIATSSTSDLPRTWLEEHNIPFIAYSYTVNDEPRGGRLPRGDTRRGLRRYAPGR